MGRRSVAACVVRDPHRVSGDSDPGRHSVAKRKRQTRRREAARHGGAAAQPRSGTVSVLPDIWSPQLEQPCDIPVYLPPAYGQRDTRYPVVYLPDAAHLSADPASTGRAWQVDQTLAATYASGVEMIVVGIPPLGLQRGDGYSPFSNRRRAGGHGTGYCQFIVETLKPQIDATFRTQPKWEQTAILGASEAGLLSVLAFFHYGAIFGRAGALSPSLGDAEHAILGYVQLAPAPLGKLYLEVGSHEGWPAISDARLMTKLLERKGYRRDVELWSLELDGASTRELAWSARLERALRFLLVQDADVAVIQAQAAAREPAAALPPDEPEDDSPADAHLVRDAASTS